MCRKKNVPFLTGGHSKMYTPGTEGNLSGKERYRQEIIQEFNLGVGSHVSITLNFAADRGGGHGEGCKPPIIQSVLLDYSVLFLIVAC